MAEFFQIFATRDAVAVHEQFLELLAEMIAIDRTARALRVPSPVAAVRARVEGAYRDFRNDLVRVAEATAKDFDARARANLQVTRRRQDNRVAPHLRNLIRSRPAQLGFADLPTGAVGLARISTLDRAVNPLTPGYGTYWRAQEYGTGQDGVPSQVGRPLRGFFYEAGLRNPQRPQLQYRGHGDPSYPIFLPGRTGKLPGSVRGGVGPGGGRGGVGEIHHEIAPRRFLRDAVDSTYGDYLTGVKAVEARALSALAGL